jgi:hypothetical protein
MKKEEIKELLEQTAKEQGYDIDKKNKIISAKTVDYLSHCVQMLWKEYGYMIQYKMDI